MVDLQRVCISDEGNDVQSWYELDRLSYMVQLEIYLRFTLSGKWSVFCHIPDLYRVKDLECQKLDLTQSMYNLLL